MELSTLIGLGGTLKMKRMTRRILAAHLATLLKLRAPPISKSAVLYTQYTGWVGPLGLRRRRRILSRTDVRNEAIINNDASMVVARRHHISTRTKFDLVFDTVLFVAFAIAYAEDFTGLSLHEWFCIAFGIALLFHFSLHWEWVVRTTKGMLTTSGRRRVMWLVNLALLGDLMLCIGSGILITICGVFSASYLASIHRLPPLSGFEDKPCWSTGADHPGVR